MKNLNSYSQVLILTGIINVLDEIRIL